MSAGLGEGNARVSGRRTVNKQPAIVAFLLIAFLVLLLPAFLNGSIFLFPDSVGYFHAGEAALDGAGKLMGLHQDDPLATSIPALPSLATRAQDGISTSRSVYYGVPFVALYEIGGGWALAVAQALVAFVSLVLAVRRLVATSWARTALIIAGIASLGGLSFFTTTAMPDLFSGLMLLCFAMLLPVWPDMSGRERGWWLVLLLAACLVHKSNLAVAAVLVGLGFAVNILARRDLRRPALLAALIATSFVGHAFVVTAVERLSGKAAVEAPFLLARIVGDGTAKLYLDRHCPESDLTLCRYRDRLPMTENQFLWSHDPALGIMHALPQAERTAILQEANRLVFGAVAEFPLHQIGASLRNFGRQFLCVGVTEYALGPLSRRDTSQISGLLARYPATPAGQRIVPFGPISVAMTVVYVAALVIVVIAGISGWQKSRSSTFLPDPRREAIVWILVGLLVNAALTGIIAGVFDRYQGRVAWLAVLAAMAALSVLTTAAPRSNLAK